IMLVPVFFIGGLLPLAIRIFENQVSGVRDQGSEGRRQKTEDGSKLNRGQTSLPRGIYKYCYSIISSIYKKVNFYPQVSKSRIPQGKPMPSLMKSNQRSAISYQQSGICNLKSSPIAYTAGRLYALNTFGGMLGAGITNYFLVPIIGTQGTLTIFSIVCLAIGLAVFTPPLFPPNKGGIRGVFLRWSFAAISVFALSAFVITLPHKLGELYTSKLARVSGGDIEPDLKLHHEGRVATITIIDFPWLGFRDMFLNGVEEASTRFSHIQLFKLLGLLPVLVHESDYPKEALMIAFGAGITAGAALDSNQVSSLDVVDLNPDIKKINDLFKEVNGDVFHDSRFNFISEDGRNYLLMNPKKYSVIMSDSTHPRAYDSWILYTKEFYEDVKDHLLPGGIFAQWIPLSDFSLEMYKIMLNTFKSVFPNVTLWNIYGTDQAFLLATPSPFNLNMVRFQNQLNSVSESLLLKKYQMDKAVDFAGFFVMDNKTIEKFIGDEKRVNTDNLPYNQKYSLKKNSPLRTKSFDQYQASIRPYLKEASEEDLAAIVKRQTVARNMYRYFFFADQAALDGALDIRPIDGNVLHYKNLERQMVRMASEKLRLEENSLRENIKVLQQKIEETPTRGKNYSQLAKIYLDLGLIDNAEALLRKALKYSPKSAKAHELMGLALANKRNWQEAEFMFEYALLKDPEDNYILDNLIRIYAEQNLHQKAVNLLLKKINKNKKTELEELGSYQDDMRIAGSYFSLKDFKNTEKFLLSALDKY
ncbi:MAG: fused MFS/spermidine synthase, partial [Nitrospinota bacterium]